METQRGARKAPASTWLSQEISENNMAEKKIIKKLTIFHLGFVQS